MDSQHQLWWRRGVHATMAMMTLLSLSAVAGISLSAQAHAATQSAPSAPASPSGHVTILVLDMSGSMAGNDPNGLRCSAANAYIDLSGPGSYVGVVGLDSPNGARGGTHNFQTAGWTLDPQEMATVNSRKALRDAIAAKSNNCRPDSATPTYDSLAKAEAMLATATKGGQLSGSVILLTDGDPDPNTDDQINAVKQELVPQFKSHNWPIDTVALGADQGFHGFLSDVASATSGSYYDDGHGIVPGVSPLNITPFFLDIFKLRNGRSPGPDIPPTQLGGGTTARNFTVGQYVTHLDVVVVKDNRDASVFIAAPNGQRFPPPAAGTFISTDPYYAIFSIDNPQQGPWELDVSGNGLFLMDSLKTSSLALSVTAPTTNAVLALGEPFTLTATLMNNGTLVSGGRFALDATLTFVGGDAKTPFAQDVVLTDTNGSGQYSATVTLPTSAPSGSYRLSVAAHAASEDVLTAEQVVRFELFPAAVLLAPDTGRPASGTVNAQALRFDPVLQIVYAPPPISWISGWPLDGHPATPSALVRGQVYLLGKPYTAASVTGTAQRAGSSTTVDATIVDDGNGAFHVYFPAATPGTYTLKLTTRGAYALTHGDLTTVALTVQVVVTPATQAQELHAWIITLIYLALLLLIGLLMRYAISPKPYGTLVSSEGGGEEFARARRGPVARLLAPSAVSSAQMSMDPGLRFRFYRGGRITVQAAGGAGGYLLQGEPVPRTPVAAGEAHLTSADGAISYHVSTARADAEEREDALWGEPKPSGGLARLTGRRRSADDDFDDDSGRRRIGLPFGRRGRDGRADDELRADPWGDDEPKTKRSGGEKRTGSGRRARASGWEDDW